LYISRIERKEMDTNVQVNKQDLRLKDRIDLELSIDPAPPKEEFSGL